MPILEVIDDNDVQSPFLLNSQKHSQKNFEELTKEEQDALLDQIASQVANDPKAFDRLAKEFLNQVKRDDFNTVTIHPQAGYVCKTHVISSSEEHKKDTPVYINICHASAIPAPPVMNENEIQKALNAEPETTYRVPLSMGQLRRGEKDAIIMDACINTQPYLRSEKDLDFRLYILELSMEYVEEILGVGLSREFTMPNIKSKGDIPGRVLRLPKPSLVSAIRTEMKQDHNENGWKLSYDLKAEESKQYVTVSIPMPDKDSNSWTIDITVTKVILNIKQKVHEIPVSVNGYQIDISSPSNKVDFYKKSQDLVLHLKLQEKRQYL